MNSGMGGYAAGQSSGETPPASDGEAERLETIEKRKSDDRKNFREVFGIDGARTSAQQYVMERMAHESFYERPFGSGKGMLDVDTMQAREGMRTFYLWIKAIANAPFSPPKRRKTKARR